MKSSAEALKDHFPGEVLHRGEGPAWRDLLIEIRTAPAYLESLFVPAVPEPHIVWALEGNLAFEEREIGGEWIRSDFQAGDLFLTTSPFPYQARWNAKDSQPALVLALYVGLPLLLEAAKDLFGEGADIPTIAEFSAKRDHALTSILELLRQELVRQEGASPLYVQGLAKSLAVHLLRAHGVKESQNSRPQARLTAFQIHKLELFLNSHLDHHIKLQDMAEQLEMSQFHFARLFKKTAGISPAKHLTRLRIARARRLLRETSLSVLEIGLEVGYSSAGHFAAAFRKENGTTPTAYRGNT